MNPDNYGNMVPTVLPSPFVRDLRAIYTLWLRDIIRLWRNRLRLAGSFVQPLIFLFVFGGGLRGRVVETGSAHLNYQLFIFPGILAMSILFTASFAGIAVVWDREVGFLKEVLVAPLSRSAVVIGKVLGESTNSLIQSTMLLALAPFFGIHLSLEKTLIAIVVMMMIAISQTAMGIALSVRMSSSQGFMVLLNFIIMPLYFLSGAMFPINGLPPWLSFLTHLDPVTYGVDLLRGVILGVHHFTYLEDSLALVFFGGLMIFFAVRLFNEESPA